MKLKEYFAHLKEIIEDIPEAGEYECVYSQDDEGNGFDEVSWLPSVGCYNKDDEEFYEDGNEDYPGLINNAICVN